MHSFRQTGCVLLLIGSLQVSVQAQSSDQYVSNQPDSSAAYWKLRAASNELSPTVLFYNAHHQLLYQEQLPESARRINLATRRALDRFLLNLNRHQLLTATYLSPISQLSEPDAPAPSATPTRTLHQVVFRKGTAVLSVEPILSPSGSLLVCCAQSSTRWLWMILEDGDHQQLVVKRCKTSSAKYSLNLTQLPSGQYYLKAGALEKPVIYRLLINQSNQQYSLQNERE